MAQIGVEDIVAAMEGHSPPQIAAGVARLVYQGNISAGDRMPVIKEVAQNLGVSAGTVAAAWKILGDLGLVESRGRSGTLVLPRPNSWLPPRYRPDTDSSAQVMLNLAEGTPDPDLLPDVTRGLILGTQDHRTMSVDSYFDPPVNPVLRDLLEASWPYHAQRITVFDGAGDALFRSLEETVRFGDRVAVEDPGYPPLFDMADVMGLVPVRLEMDSCGVTCESLLRALKAGAKVICLQPRAQNPTGVSMTPTRVRGLAQVLRRFDRARRPLIIEDDHSGLVTQARMVSLGAYLPDDVLRIQSFSKAYGPDFRMAALSGPASLIDSMVARRLLGPGWTSHLLQRLLAQLMTDLEVQRQRRAAVIEYRRRAAALASELALREVVAHPGDGLTMWIPVLNEASAAGHLLAAGIRVSVGQQFSVARREVVTGEPGPGHIRVSIGALPATDLSGVAELLAAAALLG